MTVYILNYNNYYNRLVKPKYPTIGKYLIAIEQTPEDYRYRLPNVNFNPNDGIETTLVVGSNSEGWGEYDGTGDYVLVSDKTNPSVIDSCWFIIDSKRTRGGQYELSLRRDVIADYQNLILSSPVFIEKATLGITDPLIFNKENMTYNQILKRKVGLNDPTGSNWIVGYIPKNSFTESTTITASVPGDASQADGSFSSLDAFLEYNFGVSYNESIGKSYDFQPYPGVNSTITSYWGAEGTDTYFGTEFGLGSYTLKNTKYTGTTGYPSVTLGPGQKILDNNRQDSVCFVYMPWGENSTKEQIRELVPTVLLNVKNQEQTAKLNYLIQNGYILHDESTGFNYKLTVEENPVRISQTKYVPVGSSLYNKIVELSRFGDVLPDIVEIKGTPNAKSYKIYYNEPAYNIVATRVETQVKTRIDNTRLHCDDSPYDIFCIPAMPITVKDGETTVIQSTNKYSAFQIATAIGTQSGLSNTQFDIQLLPYCPATYSYVGKNLSDSGGIDISGATVDYIEDDQGNKLNCILWATKSSFSLRIPFSEPPASDKIELKVQSECDVHRIVSPNYNGMYEFNVAKNEGISGFDVSCNYKPYNPFIHIKPVFNGLYGIYRGPDIRGLVCGGDFSLPQVTNAFATYELNNKNYQAMFDRGIQSQEVRNAVQSEQDIASAVFGSISGGTSGAIAGSVAGPVGALIGGTVGLGASLAGGLYDASLNRKLRSEALDYTKDMFGYQLGNIQAIPNSVAKTGSNVSVNEPFPVLEYYTCTDEEKQALRDKIKYNGMTVMKIGTIGQYMWDEPTYIKGKLIRLEGSSEDFHVVNTIAEELNKGVFI